MIWLIPLLFFIGCAPKVTSQEQGAGGSFSIDNELQLAVSTFEAEFGVKVNFDIKYADTLSGSNAGICNVYSNGRKEVLILKSVYKSSTPYQQLALMFHELGHCALGKGHDNATVILDGNVRPKSIMNYAMFTVNEAVTFQNNYRYYTSELK